MEDKEKLQAQAEQKNEAVEQRLAKIENLLKSIYRSMLVLGAVFVVTAIFVLIYTICMIGGY